jgi:hypothetical protein
VKYEFLRMVLAEDSDLVGCDAVLLVEWNHLPSDTLSHLWRPESRSTLFHLCRTYKILSIHGYYMWAIFLSFQTLPDQQHCYFMTENKTLEGILVSNIPFSHPAHVPQILMLLRQQALFNVLVSSCIRSASKHGMFWFVFGFIMTVNAIFTVIITAWAIVIPTRIGFCKYMSVCLSLVLSERGSQWCDEN